MKSKMLDLLSVFSTVFILLPYIYFTSNHATNNISLVFLILISIPTIMAMVNGAPFVPTPMARVKKMLQLANIKKGNRVYDIGCGDGRMVFIAANKYGAKATGLELSPIVYLLAKIRKLFWKSKAEIKFTDFKRQNISDADFIFCYLLPDCIKTLEKKLVSEMKQGAKIVSYAFEFPYLKLIQKEERDQENNFAPIFIYEKP